MKLFRLWTRDEIVTAIRDLEAAITSGAQSISYVGGGTVAQVASSEMLRTVRSLYERLDEIDGVKVQPRMQHIRVQPSRGF